MCFKNLRLLGAILFSATTLSSGMTSCIGDSDVDYDDWRDKNAEYIAEARNSVVDGKPEYEVINPIFAPQTFILMKWHNDRSKTEKALVPLDNSTVDCKYICRNIEGTYIDSSFASTTYGDSIYRTQPLKNITGFWSALTNMHVGDSVTVIIPHEAGYGINPYGSVKPYSVLIYDIKLKSIPSYERP